MGIKLKQCTDFEKHYERFTDILGGNRDLDPCPWCLQKRIEELEQAAQPVLDFVEFELRGTGQRDKPPWKGPLDRLKAALEDG